MIMAAASVLMKSMRFVSHFEKWNL
jgi:hypothetical protein